MMPDTGFLPSASDRSVRTSLNGLRGLLAILIFLHHFVPLRGIETGADFGNFVVMAFFALSGYSLTMSYRDRVTRPDFSFKSFLVRRGARIYPIQWLTVLLAVLAGGASLQALPFHLTLTQSFFPKWEIYWVMNIASWYLSSLLLSYLLFVPVLRLFLKYGRTMHVLFVLAVIGWAAVSVLLPASIGRRWLCYVNPFARVLDFVLGVVVALQIGSVRQRMQRLSVPVLTLLEVLAVAVAALSMVWTPWFAGRFIPKAYWYPAVVFLIVMFASQCRGVVSGLLHLRPCTLLGEMSLSIYMMQAFCIGLYGYRLVSWPHVPALALMFAGLCLVSWVVTKYYLPWSADWFSRMCGIRSKN